MSSKQNENIIDGSPASGADCFSASDAEVALRVTQMWLCVGRILRYENDTRSKVM
jgi:hypothetical protein